PAESLSGLRQADLPSGTHERRQKLRKQSAARDVVSTRTTTTICRDSRARVRSVCFHMFRRAVLLRGRLGGPDRSPHVMFSIKTVVLTPVWPAIKCLPVPPREGGTFHFGTIRNGFRAPP